MPWRSMSASRAPQRARAPRESVPTRCAAIAHAMAAAKHVSRFSALRKMAAAHSCPPTAREIVRPWSATECTASVPQPASCRETASRRTIATSRRGRVCRRNKMASRVASTRTPSVRAACASSREANLLAFVAAARAMDRVGAVVRRIRKRAARMACATWCAVILTPTPPPTPHPSTADPTGRRAP